MTRGDLRDLASVLHGHALAWARGDHAVGAYRQPSTGVTCVGVETGTGEHLTVVVGAEDAARAATVLTAVGAGYRRGPAAARYLTAVDATRRPAAPVREVRG